MAGRYEEDLQGDSPQLVDGDGFFVGLDSRTEPENLAPGIVSVAENMRFNQRKGVVRAGMEKQTNDISFGGLPLLLPFVLDGTPVLRVVGTDGIYESCVFSSQSTNLEYIAVATAQSAFLFRPGVAVVELAYPAGEVISEVNQVDMFQVGGSVYILRGLQNTPVAISSISRTGSTATVTTATAHGYVTGDFVRVSGAYPTWYDATSAITVLTSTTFTYTLVATPTNLADRVFETVTNAEHVVSKIVNVAGVLPLVMSIYAKPNGRDWIMLRYTDGAPTIHSAFFNVTTGAIGTASNATGAITSAGGGWYRCSIAFTPTLGGLSVADFLTSTNGATISYVGDVTKGLYLYGAQLELNTAPSIYQPTAGTTVAPNLFIRSDDFTTWAVTNVTVTGNNTAEPATGLFTLAVTKIPLRWDGDFTQDFIVVNSGTISAPYIYMPPSSFGLIMQNRAVLQYGRNQAIVSEVLAVEQYNSIYGVFNFRQGEADYLQGFHSYQDNECLVFNRRSIYILAGLDGPVELMTKAELTRQIGCVSRRSIATCGAMVLFLSDNGVYKLEPGLELQLRGNTEPLSAPVDNVIRTINTAAIQKAYGIFFNNRYYLAIPTNSSTRNNVMLVYNFLNQQWESKDSFPNGFYCDWMEVINDGSRDILYLISLEGGIYAYEQLEFDEFGAADQDPASFVIPGNLVTRRLIYGDTDLKQFLRVSASVSFDATSGMTIKAITTNPEATKTISTQASTPEEEMTIRALVNMRGYGLQFQFQNTAGRVSISNYRANAYTSDRKTITTQ